MILLDRDHLGLADLEVDRNAYGRQVRSFEADVMLADDPVPLRGVFIRAPRIEPLGPDVGSSAFSTVSRCSCATVGSCSPFHPELTDDRRVHERFLELVREEQHVRA